MADPIAEITVDRPKRERAGGGRCRERSFGALAADTKGATAPVGWHRRPFRDSWYRSETCDTSPR
ncbi:MAG: hypothetical protein PGN21_17160 [Sphingomonas paucimobilis]